MQSALKIAIIVETNKVHCPYCKSIHKHGSIKSGDIRSSHCGKGDYTIYEASDCVSELKNIFL